MQRRFLSIPLLFMVFGIAATLTAVLGEIIGVDLSTDWGPRRIALLVFGLVLMIGAAAAWYDPATVVSARRRIQFIADKLPGRRLQLALREYWIAIPISALVFLIYVWFISSGTWTSWASPTRYYTDLARGFDLGHLYLARNVSPLLLTSPDPYSANTGGEIQVPLDLSYYQGRYYLYWGPVPALVLLLTHWAFHRWLGDLHLVFGFVCGLYLVQSWLAAIIWNRYFRNLPKWTLWISLLVTGLVGPVTFMLDTGRSARVYEAAVVSGQFFFMSGLLIVLTAMDRPSFRWGPALAGILWALAIGSRYDLIVPIGLVVVGMSGSILIANHWSLKAIAKLIPLGLMLVLGCAGVGWYNWARFGSVLETGFYYQLSTLGLQQHWNALFSLNYILPNLYNYLVGPAAINSEFPFLHAGYARTPAALFLGGRSSFYSSQWVTGVLWMAPLAIFAVMPVARALNSLFKKNAAPAPAEALVPLRMVLILGGACLASLGFLSLYFWAAMRFVEEFVPLLLMLSIIGFWQGFQLLSGTVIWRRAYAGLGSLLAVASIATSLLLGMSALTARSQLSQLFPFLK